MEAATEPEKQGFTLMEFLILAIILAIIAAITVPRFSRAAQQARLTDLVSDLQMVR